MEKPLMTKEFIDDIKESQIPLSGNIADKEFVIFQLRKSLELLERQSYQVLHYILLHSKRVVVAGTYQIEYFAK